MFNVYKYEVFGEIKYIIERDGFWYHYSGMAYNITGIMRISDSKQVFGNPSITDMDSYEKDESDHAQFMANRILSEFDATMQKFVAFNALLNK